MKKTIKSNKMDFQLAPPHDHHCNLANKAIQTFKDHFVAILCGTDKSFPLHLWDHLLPQAELTLNMLRPSQMMPTISTYAYLWKQHSYNANPFAPLGCKVKTHLVPTIRKSWAPHTASGFYVGNAWDHYWCHEIYISDTRHMRVCNTVFFKHKYLTMPIIAAADALIRAANDLTNAIAGVVPPPNMTQEAVEQLMVIFKQQAEKAKDNATTQRVLKEHTQAERVHNESMSNHSPHTPVEVPYPNAEFGHVPETPVISQDEDNTIRAYPAANTRQQRKVRTITQDYLFHMMDIPGRTKPFNNQQAASRKYPLQFLCDFAAAVLDDKTGDLLEYRHLIRHPKYRDTWSKLFGTEIHWLATTTETIAFMSKDMIPHNRCKDIMYGQIVWDY
jgi:hypothetical protein